MMLRGLSLAGALLVAALPAAAQVRAAASAAESGSSAAGVSALSTPALPLSYALMLHSPAPTLSAGNAFLADSAAQRWFAVNRPEQLPALMQGALNLSDWEQVLTSYDDPRLLREAILSRPGNLFTNSPTLLLKLVDRTPALAAKRRLFEEAVLEWSILAPETRAALAAASAPEDVWTRLPLPNRYETLRRVLQESAGSLITGAPGDPEFAAQYEAALRRMGMVMTDEEFAGHKESIARAKRLEEAQSRAARRAGDSAAETAAALAVEPEDAVATPSDLSPEEARRILTRLMPAINGLLRGTPSGDALLAAVSGSGLGLGLGATSRDAALATYNTGTHSIVLGQKQLAQLLAALGRAPRDLLTDDEALADAAVLYSHLYVHEATHHLQDLWAHRVPAEARALTYNQQSEVEANNAQAKFLKEKRAVDPAFAAREARLRDVWGMVAAVMRQPEALASDPAAMSSWLARGYRHVPTLQRSSARLIAYGLYADRRDAWRTKAIDAELARRRRLSAAERQELERSPGRKKIATSDLRSFRDSFRGQAQAMVEAARALSERARVELAKLAEESSGKRP
jgi:hypothetical protein